MKCFFKKIKKIVLMGSPKKFTFMVVVTILSAIAEIFTVGALFPLLSSIVKPDNSLIFSNDIVDLSSYSLKDYLFVFLTITCCGGALRLLWLWKLYDYSYDTTRILSVSMFEKVMCLPYIEHLSGNKNTYISTIYTKVDDVVNGSLIPLLYFLSAAFMATLIVLVLLFISPELVLYFVIIVSLLYVLTMLIVKKLVSYYGKIITSNYGKSYSILYEAFHGIRDIILSHTHKFFRDLFSDSQVLMRSSQRNIEFIGQSPKYIFETFSMIAIVILLGQSNNPRELIPALGTLLFSCQKLLPLMQQIYRSLMQIQGSSASLDDCFNLLSASGSYHTDNRISDFNFEKSIELCDVSFNYLDACVFDKINLRITKGQKIGIIGSTGSGKSTLIDILLGFLWAEKGTVSVDGVNVTLENAYGWQNKISHVPQSIFISDSTAVDNIAFGVPPNEVDLNRVYQAAKIACVDDVINALPQGYSTLLGDMGSRLSGGEKQRIAIARAFYKGSSVLILDEATSALDVETERAVMENVYKHSNNITLIVIAHRKNTLEICDAVYEIRNCKVVLASHNKVGEPDLK